MSVEPPPYDGSAGFNPDNWTPDAGTGAVDEQYLADNYLQFPLAQGSETLGDAIISGTLTAQDASFADVVNLNSDTIATGNFTINSNTGATNTVSIYPQSTFNGSVIMNGTLTANEQATFAGDSNTGNANAPIKLTNGVSGQYATFYLNPSTGEDITLYTNQNPNGGLTIRGANGASFTMNPATVQDGVGCSLINPLSMNGQTLSGLNNVYANTGSTITIQSPISLGANATATTQASGNSTTAVATTAFVQDAVQVSGVQTTDSPLLWQGINTWQYNGGTPANLPYNYTYGISNSWNITGGQGDCDVIANAGTGVSSNNAYNIYCVQNNITGSTLLTTTPQLSLSNNGTSMQVKDGVNIPVGKTYSINNVNILSPYSTTTQMNSAISTALTPYAPINSPTFTGLPLLTTTPTAGVSNAQAIANLQYITNQGFLTSASLSAYAPLASPALTGNPTAPTQPAGTNNTTIATTQYVQNIVSTLAQTYPPNTLTPLTGGLATNWIIVAPIPTYLTGTVQGTTVYLNDCTFTARINYQGQGDASISFFNLGRNLATTVSAFNMTGSIVNLTILDTYPMYLTYFVSNPSYIKMQNSDIPTSFWNTGGNYQITFSGAFTFT